MRLGTLAAMSLVHGGGAFRIFGSTVFHYLSGKKAAELIANIDEVPDAGTREILRQVCTIIYLCHSVVHVYKYMYTQWYVL